MLFSQRLRSIRNSMDLNQKEFAHLLKINPVTLSHYENGKREPDLERLFILCKELNVTADYILGLTDSMNGTQSIPVSIPTSTVQRDPFFGLTPDQRELIENNIALMRKQNEKALAVSTQEA